MATRIVRKEKPVARLWVFAPPHRLFSGTTKLADSTVVGYVALPASGRLEAGEAPIALLPRCRRLDIVFDGGDVFLTTVVAPKLTESKLRLALPNLLEDRLLAEPTDCHFAFQAGGGGGGGDVTPGSPPQLPVAVIDRGLLTRMLDVFAAMGERARAAYSAIYVLPPPSGQTLPVFIARGRAVARTGRHEGVVFDFDAEHPPAALQLALRQGGWQRLRAFGSQAVQLASMAEALGVPVDVADSPLDPEATVGAINLLQGPFARGGPFGDLALPRLSARAWRAPIVWALIGVAVFIAGMNGYWLKLRAEADTLRDRMTTAFRSAFPEAEMVDPIVQTQRELVRLRARAGQSSAGDFTALNAQVAQLLSSAPVGIVASVEYRDGALQLKFKSPPDGQLQNQLRAQAIQQGLQLRFDADGAARVISTGT
jgi:general secretion pathway protein L